ncbi:MAG: hypothetical protein R3A47_05285 [Polyangiales bacterium]
MKSWIRFGVLNVLAMAIGCGGSGKTVRTAKTEEGAKVSASEALGITGPNNPGKK